MCGIVGYTARKDVENRILNTLELLEYRGYDSAGLAIYNEKFQQVVVRKCAGRVSDLREKCQEVPVAGTCGIGHTRWATHGGVCDENAHPHRCGRVTLVHNGIIENYEEIRDHFGLGGELISETDTEVIAALIDKFYDGRPRATISRAIKYIKGTFALVIMFDDKPGVIYAVRNVSPIVAAYTGDGTMLASDVAALGGQADKYMVVPEYHIVELHQNAILVYDEKDQKVKPEFLEIDWDTTRDGKGRYPFYMEKEIMEQPEVIKNALCSRIVDGHISLETDGIPDPLLTDCSRIVITACGTARHVGLASKALMQNILRMHVDVEYASEFLYSNPVIDEKTLVIVISQSGETIDTLEALKYARRQGARSIGVINVKGSSIARESDYVMYTAAGPEIAVASTKAYTTQLAVMYALIGRMAVLRGNFDESQEKSFIEGLLGISAGVQNVLDRRTDIHRIARDLLEAKDAFMIGRGLDYTILLEGALKLKEISYIHTEAYASGELKHGTIALITENTPVIAVVTQHDIKEKELSNIREVQSRGAQLTLFVSEDMELSDQEKYSHVFRLPAMDDRLSIFPVSAALQLLAYYVSMDRGLDVDKPRNLAKVVTVE